MGNQDRAMESTFDWSIYSDATLAGLSVLIPVPYVDTISEDFFRNRMVTSIARRRRQSLHPQADDVINHSQFDILSRIGGCLLWPFRFAVDLLLRLSRKIVYFLTVKKAIDALNYYWQRAYLLDYMVRQGYLAHQEQLIPATRALTLVLKEHSTSPLTSLAREVLQSPRRLVRGVQHVRHGQNDNEIDALQQAMRASWDEYGDYFEKLRRHFDSAFELQLAER